MNQFERIVLEVGDSTVEFRFADGTRLDVPREVISRSKLLTQTILSAEHNEHISLNVPTGVLQTWLLGSALQSPSWCSPFSPELSAYDPQLPAYINAASFVVDEGLLEHACQLAGRRLFEVPQHRSQMPSPRKLRSSTRAAAELRNKHAQAVGSAVDERLLERLCKLAGRELCELPQHRKRKQPDSSAAARRLKGAQHHINALPTADTEVLDDLPDDLVISILRAASNPLKQQLRALPQVFHTSALCAAFPCMSAARTLKLECVSSLRPHLARIFSLATGAGLMQLDLRNSNVHGSVADELAPHLGCLTCLIHLNLGRNKMGAVGIKALAPHLAGISALQHLDLQSNAMGDAGADALAPNLDSLTALTHLGLGDNDLRDAGIVALGCHIARFTSLRHLNLARNRMGDAGAEALGCHIASLTSLQHIDLSDNSIGHAGADALGPHIASLTSLQHLDLSITSVGDAGVEALGPHIASLTSLQHLDLQENIVGDEGITALRLHIASLTCLHLHDEYMNVDP